MKEDPKWANLAARAAKKIPKCPPTNDEIDAEREYRAENSAFQNENGDLPIGDSAALSQVLDHQAPCVAEANARRLGCNATVSLINGHDSPVAINRSWDEDTKSKTCKIPLQSAADVDRQTSPIIQAPRVHYVDTRHLPADSNAEMAKPIPRNKACPCGSQRKYKKCCGKDTQSIENPQFSMHSIIVRDAADHQEHADNTEDNTEEGPAKSSRQGVMNRRTTVVPNIMATEHKGVRGIHQPCSITPQGNAVREAEVTGEYDDGTTDYGGFSMGEICVALGKGNLDEERFRRLKAGFTLLMNQSLGRA